jgi:hypothetical protein
LAEEILLIIFYLFFIFWDLQIDLWETAIESGERREEKGMYIIYRSCLLPRELERPTMAGIIDEIENERELPLHFYLSPLFVVTFNMMRKMLFCDIITVDTWSNFQESLTSIMADTWRIDSLQLQ